MNPVALLAVYLFSATPTEAPTTRVPNTSAVFLQALTSGNLGKTRSPSERLASVGLPQEEQIAWEFTVVARESWIFWIESSGGHIHRGRCFRESFAPGPSVTISPASNDPRTPTSGDAILYPYPGICPFYDVTGDNITDWDFRFSPRSLRDIGRHQINCLFGSVPNQATDCWTDSTKPPCFQSCNPDRTVWTEGPRFVIHVINHAPTASPSWTPTSPTWSSLLQFQANSSDPDGGNDKLVHRWSITSRPTGSTANLTNSGSATPSLQLGSDKDIGRWSLRLEVDDNEGEMRTFTAEFTVPNVPPSLEVTGASQVVAGKPISLGVTSTTDSDGGNLTFVWDVLSAPTQATPQPRNGYSTQSSLNISTTGREVGTWRFRVTGKDNENASVTRETTVEVVNIKPRIQFSGAPKVTEGNSIHVETTILTDEDGGDLSFQWQAVQAPQRAGLPVPSILSTSATLTRSPSQAAAGTYIFRLTATDDEGESVSEEFTVLVDGAPEVAYAHRPAEHTRGVGNLVLDASSSEDPDSPCPYEPSGCHLTDGRFATVSPGLVGYAWYARGGSQPSLARVQALFPHVSDTGPVLTFGPQDLSVGEWNFELRVQDGEGNETASQFSVTVVTPDAPPIPRISGPVPRPTVLLSGQTLANIAVDGSLSMDPDNTLDGTPSSPGLGISRYAWVAVPPTPGCPVPALPSGPGASRLVLFPAGTVVHPACQGRWTVQLTVTDDDPAAQTALATTQFSIGNCLSLACLDTPRTGQPRVVPEDDTSGVLVAAHLDSAFYDELLFALGTVIRMDVIVTGTSTIVYSGTTPMLNQQSRGYPVFLSWDGRSSGGAQLSGTFDIILSVHTQAGVQSGMDSGRQVVVLEDVRTQVLPNSENHARLERLKAGTDDFSFQVTTSGMLSGYPLGAIQWRIKNTGNAIVASGTLPGGSGSTHTVTWDGRAGGTLQPAGYYTFEAEAVRNGHPLGVSNEHAFTLYTVVADPVVIAPGSPGVAPDWVHLERSVPALSVTSANFLERRFRMSPLAFRVDPLLRQGIVTLEQESGTAVVELFEEGTTYRPLTLPLRWRASNRLQLNARMLAHGSGDDGDVVFKLTYEVDGVVLEEERIRYRLGPAPASVGVFNPFLVPHFREVRTVNAGSPVLAALDTTRHRERTGRRADVYLVPHRTAVGWVADNNLVDRTGGAKRLDVGAANMSPAALQLWAAAAQGDYDVVYDFGNFAASPGDFVGDGRLDPGDLLASPSGLAAVEVEGSYLTPGPFATMTVEYGGPYDSPLYTAHLPAGWDGVQPVLTSPPGFSFPLRGQVVYPTDLSVQRPLVVFVHGNHSPLRVLAVPVGGGSLTRLQVDTELTSDENYRGYTYLQEHLASRGFITVSIDLDGAYGVAASGYPALDGSAGILARAWATLKNIELLLTTNAVLPLVGKIDATRIYLVGHSRGGEAVVVAESQLKDLRSGTPPPGATPPGQTLVASMLPGHIKGIVSLAPVSMVVKSGPVHAQSAPFFLLYGSADGDVNGASDGVRPFMHYDRAAGERFALRLEGADHNSFNTSWGYSDARSQLISDGSTPYAHVSRLATATLSPPVGDAATLVDPGAQRDAAKAYLTAFLLMVERGDRGAREYFLQPPTTLAPLGLASTLKMHTQSGLPRGATHVTVLDDYESNPSPALSSSGLPVSYTVDEVDELLLEDNQPFVEAGKENRFFQATTGQLFSWNMPRMYEQELAPAMRNLRKARTLNFRLAQQPLHPRTLGGPLSLQVELVDGAGRAQAIPLRGIDPVAPIYEARIFRPSQYLSDGSPNPNVRRLNTTSAAFKTYRIPVAAFAGTPTGVDLGNIRKVRFRMGDAGETVSGRVALDDLEIEF